MYQHRRLHHLCLLLVATVIQANGQFTVRISLDTTYQTIEGFGTVLRPSDAVGDAINDMRITNARIFMDPEYNTNLERQNDNADPDVLDITKFTHNAQMITSCKQAYAAGCRVFFATILSPPIWMKDLSTNAYSNQGQWACPTYPGLCGGVLRSDMYDEFAEWIEGSIIAFRQQAGFDLTCVSIQNEPRFAEPYGSTVYSTTQMRDVVKKVGDHLAAKGIHTPLMLPEDVLESFSNVRAYIGVVCSDTAARKYVGYFGVHGYASNGVTPGGISPSSMVSLATLATQFGKSNWMTETSGYSADVTGGMNVAFGIHAFLAYGNGVAWTYYAPLTKAENMVYYVHKNYAAYVRPGAIRVKAESPDTARLLATAYKNPRDSAVTVVFVNRQGQQQVTLSGSGLPSQFAIYTTSATQNCVANGTASNATSYALTLPASSVTTLRGILPQGVAVRSAGHAEPALIARSAVSSRVRVFDVMGREMATARHAFAGSGLYLTSADGVYGTKTVRLTRRAY